MSSSTRSGRWCSRSRRASPALSASSTSCPSSARISESSSRIPTSSSTTRICAMVSGCLRRRAQCGAATAGHGQKNGHRCPLCRTILDRQFAVMFVDDFLHYREAKAGTALLGGDVRLEDSRHHFLRKTAAVVDHREAHLVPLRFGGYLDHRLLAGILPVLKRILRVLHQIVEYLPDLRRIGPYLRAPPAEAAPRCACISCVMSSNTRT